MTVLSFMIEFTGACWVAFLLYLTFSLVPHVFRNGPCRTYDPVRILLWFIAFSRMAISWVGVTFPSAGLGPDAIAARMGALALSALCAIVGLIMMHAYRGL